MTRRLGLDTNLLIYAWLEAHSHKGELARGLLRSSFDKVLPLQVAAETLAVARRKRPDMQGEVGDRFLELIATLTTVDTSLAVLSHAVGLSRSHGLQIYDAVIIAASASAGASILLSEDMQDGQRIAGLRILNPFGAANRAEVDTLLA